MRAAAGLAAPAPEEIARMVKRVDMPILANSKVADKF